MGHGNASRALCLAGVTLALGGCGASASRGDPALEARLVAEANSLCRSMTDRVGYVPPRGRPRLATLVAEIREAAVYLPAGRDLNEVYAKRKALAAELHKLDSSDYSAGEDILERSYHQQMQIHDDEKALGLGACLGRRPRAPISG
jgi:hypothetical protein